MAKFQIGELVKIVESGNGINYAGIGAVVEITDNTGVYINQFRVHQVGYKFKIIESKGDFTHNGDTGRYGGWCGEISFQSCPEDNEAANNFTKDE